MKHLSFFILSFLPMMLLAQKPIDSLHFATDQKIFTAEIYQNRLYIGGNFKYVGKKTGPVAFFFNNNSEPDGGMPVFGDINPSGEADYNDVKTVLPDGRGGWFVGGSFRKVNNRDQLYLAHILPNKQIDGGFIFPFNDNITFGGVNALKKDDHYLYVGGMFEFSDGGNTYKNIFRVNLSTLKIDPVWNPALSHSKYISQIELSSVYVFLSGWIGEVDTVKQGSMVVLDKTTAKPIYLRTSVSSPTIHLLGNDTLLMANLSGSGILNSGDGNAVGGFGYIVDGVSLFDEKNDMPLKPSVHGNYYAIIPDGRDGWYAAGVPLKGAPGVYHFDRNMNTIFSQTAIRNFSNSTRLLLHGNTLYLCTSTPYTPGSIYKLDATTGEKDQNFAPKPNGRVWGMAVKGDTLFVAGNFNKIAGVERTGIAALHADNGTAYDWTSQINDVSGFYYGLGEHRVSDLLIVNDTLYASGIFNTDSENNDKNISSLVRYDLTTGKLDTSFHFSRGEGSLPLFHSMAYAGDKLYLAGDFSLIRQADTLRNVAVIDLKNRHIQNLNSDIRFGQLPKQTFNAQGLPMVKEFNGRLYFSGLFALQLAPKQATRFYFISINESTMTFTDWNPAPSGPVYAMAFHPGRVVLSGLFYFVKYNPLDLMGIDLQTNRFIDRFPFLILPHGAAIASSGKYVFIGSGMEKYGDSLVHGLARLKRKDLSITHFDHQINDNAPFFIHNMALGSQGLFVTGFYNVWSNNHGSFNVVAHRQRQNVCLLDPESGSLKSWNPPPYNADKCRVFAFGNDVVLTGIFSLMPALSRSGLAAIDLTTGRFTDWNPALGDRFAIANTILISGDTVFVGGDQITKVNDKDAGNLIAVDARTGTLIDGFASPDLDGAVSTLFKKGNRLYVGGNFKNINSVSHRYIARFNTDDGRVDAWDPQLDGSWNLKVNDIAGRDTLLYIAGAGLGISGNTGDNLLLRVSMKTAALKKSFPGAKYTSIGSIALNNRGDLVAGMLTNYNDNADFYRLDTVADTLVAINDVPEFSEGIRQIKPLDNAFLVAGNHMKEKGKSTLKPGLFVYNPEEDTMIAAFSTPVMDGNINTFAVDDQMLVFVGDFGGMNQERSNADLAFMQTPDLQWQPGVSSWSPKTANDADPFSVSVYGNGFTQNSTVRLVSENIVKQPDSLSISARKMIAYFNGKDFTPGQWSLKVEITPGNPLLFTDAVNIEKGEKTDLWMDWSSPDVVLANKPVNCYLSFGNRGSRAALGVFLYLAVGPNQTVEWPESVTPLKTSFSVDMDTVSPFVSVDYFLGEPYHGRVYSLFIPYMPANYQYTYHLKVTTVGTESAENEIRYAISKPLFVSVDELSYYNKAAQGVVYDFFRCAYDVVGIAVDLTPGAGCIKSFFDNTVVAGLDKYMNDESVSGYDVANSVGMIALGCVPGGAEMGKAYKISKEMVEMGSDATGVFSSCKKVVDDAVKDSKNMKSRFSHDPNAKYGPSGQATSPFVRTGQPFRYLITFENDSAATASAQRVIITDTLDKNVFDLSRFKPLGFGFGDTAYFYKETDGDTVDIDLRPEKDIIVRVFYHLSQDDGVLTWTFLTLDPNTYELTDDVYAGFLPPNKKAPEGEGNVLYSVLPFSGLNDGTAVNNAAHIVFDWNSPVPTGRWHNVTDNTSPESAVKPLPDVTYNKNFTVSWGGNDPGSGIYSYSVYVAENDSAYYVWIPDTKDTLAVFSGEAGSVYKFYSVAIDSAGNKEPVPAVYDAITRVVITGIDNFGKSNQTEWRVYPNPATNKATIDVFLPEPGHLRIDLLNNCGHLVKTVFDGNKTRGKGSVQTDISSLPAGFYFVRMQTKQGVQTRKLVKQ